MKHLPKYYHPKDSENLCYSRWVQNAFFVPSNPPDSGKVPFVVLMPPPNITAQLHMGHALNNTLIDVLIRWYRLLGRDVLYQPGTDHAGIATQNVLEKELLKQGLSRRDLSREALMQRFWLWKEKYGSRILQQLRALGCACDWSRESFTLDRNLSESVSALFVRLYDEGLVYKGNYIVNWCPHCETALSNEEVEYQERESFLYYIAYPVVGEDAVIPVATTRPETLFGDLAVAVAPNDSRYLQYLGKKLRVPLVNRLVPLIADESVHSDFGSGAVKITPAHDANDFLVARRHSLGSLVVLSPQGQMTDAAPGYVGLDRFVCRERVLEDLAAQGLLIEKKPYQQQIATCYRCHELLEPYLSSQWFVKMRPLAKAAIQALKEGHIRFYPEKWAKTYLHWLENIEDWCISRQITWGHRIPVWTCEQCGQTLVRAEIPQYCSSCRHANLKQETDVLDTWFSSMLWPLSPFGWPRNTLDLERFYPSNVLITAPEIVFFWVARMVMIGLYLRGAVPFADVYLHATVRDALGRKMSKSLGNGVDPLEVIELYGADALRFTLLRLAPFGEDMKLSFQKTPHAQGLSAQDDFVHGARFVNKIWNLARFVLMSTENRNVFPSQPLELELADAWILLKLSDLAAYVREMLEKYRFDLVVKALYHFVWNNVCDCYVELAKYSFAHAPPQKQHKTAAVLLFLLQESLKLLHPLIPFVTEVIWGKLPHRDPQNRESILLCPPFAWNDSGYKDLFYGKMFGENSCGDSRQSVFEDMALVLSFVEKLRVVASEQSVKSRRMLMDLVFVGGEASVLELCQKYSGYFCALTGYIHSVLVNPDYHPAKSTVMTTHQGCHLCIELVESSSTQARKSPLSQKQCMQKKIDALNKRLTQVQHRLQNPQFLHKAKADIVQKHQAESQSLQNELQVLYEHIRRFG